MKDVRLIKCKRIEISNSYVFLNEVVYICDSVMPCFWFWQLLCHYAKSVAQYENIPQRNAEWFHHWIFTPFSRWAKCRYSQCVWISTSVEVVRYKCRQMQPNDAEICYGNKSFWYVFLLCSTAFELPSLYNDFKRESYAFFPYNNKLFFWDFFCGIMSLK